MTDLDRAVAAYQENDFAQARLLATQAADTGESQAHYLLGVMHSFGNGGPPDPVTAAGHYRVAAESGHAAAAYCLAALYAQGRGVAQDFAEALRWYRRAADAGDVDALFKIGVMYASGEGMAANLAEAQRWWRQAARKEQPDALLFLGHLAARGELGERDPLAAAEWYLKAWQAGSDHAAAALAALTPVLERAADEGSATAQNALGVLHKFAREDHKAAARRFAQAAAQDHPEALRLLAHCHEHGEGVPQDEEIAAKLYERAAECGDGRAQFSLALFHADGRGGLTQDVDQAIHWLRRAADQGLMDAVTPLAQLLAFRNRDRADANEAVQRLMAVAGAGPANAEYRLAAGDGAWSVVLKERGAVVTARGLDPEELRTMPGPGRTMDNPE